MEFFYMRKWQWWQNYIINNNTAFTDFHTYVLIITLPVICNDKIESLTKFQTFSTKIIGLGCIGIIPRCRKAKLFNTNHVYCFTNFMSKTCSMVLFRLTWLDSVLVWEMKSPSKHISKSLFGFRSIESDSS